MKGGHGSRTWIGRANAKFVNLLSSILDVTGMVGFPLSLLILLNLGISKSLFFFDRFPQEPVLYALPLHLDLMVCEGTVELRRPLFRELAPFDIELTCIVHALAGSAGEAAHVVKSPLEGFPLFRGLRIDDWRLGKPVIDIDAKRNQPVSNGILLGRPASRVRLSQFHRVCLWCRGHNGD